MDSGSEADGREGDGKRGWKEEKARCAATLTTIPRVQLSRSSPQRRIMLGSGGGQEK